MGISFFNCDACNETIPDCGSWFTCKECEIYLCEDCEKQYQCGDYYEYEEVAEQHENCPFCTLKLVSDEKLFTHVYELFNITKEELKENYITEKRRLN